MKYFLIVGIVASLSQWADGDAIKFFEKGATDCVAFDAAEKNPRKKANFETEDIYSTLVFTGWVQGWLSGVNASPIIKSQKKSPLDFPDPWMMDPKKFAPSILAFVKENKPENFPDHAGGKGSYLMLAWYLKNHSGSTDFERNKLSKICLDWYFSPKESNRDEDLERIRQKENTH